MGSSSNSDDPMLKNCLFGAVTLTKNSDIDKYGYSGYGISFDRKSSFSFPGGRFGQNVLIFVVDRSSSAHIDNKKKDISVLGKGPTQGLEHTLTAEKMYSISFTVTKKKFCLSLHYNGANSYLFVNGKEVVRFKTKDSAIVATPLCLENFSKDCFVNNMKKNWTKRICLRILALNPLTKVTKALQILHDYCRCRLDASVCNNKQGWNNDKCRC